MCGIAGLINLDKAPISPLSLKRMTDAIIHRGPDDEGHWIEGNVGIGHRRLAIIDPTPAGHQPMLTKNSRYVLTYNGEVYNYKEIRTELSKLGYEFRSQSDSEVVLHALVEWGKDAFVKFNGMFALAMWDRKTQKLLLARDRYGIKPLYYSLSGNKFSFGSEQKAITAQSSFNRKVNTSALLEYFTFQNIFTDQTLLENISLLQAGYFAELDVYKKKFQQTKYWDYHFVEPETPANKLEYIEELNRLFKQAVNRQLISDTELGCYLSGGMDSGAITAIASQKYQDLKSFTIGFDLSSASGMELGFDERRTAEAMSASFKTEHYQMVLKSGDMERCLPRLARHLEEPRVGQSYPNYYAAKLASKFVKVVLSGTGGDELFGGYPWRYYRAAKSLDFEDYIDKYYLYWQRLVDNKDLKRIFAPIEKEVAHVWTRDIFKKVFPSYKNNLKNHEECINHSLYFEAKTFLHGLFLVEDKLSMAHSLESRVPFMDNDLVDFAMKCPIKLKLNNLADVVRINENEIGDKQNKYFLKTNDGKQIFRDVMAHYIPKSITEAEKQGFSSPDASWFKGESIDFVKNILGNDKAHIYQFFDKKAVEEIVGEHLTGKTNRRLLIWSLLNIEYWLKDITE
ncbi:MAG: asparagine synthase (glutamine-hydrolyzing) [Candidatus Endolissoclinum sp. TMED37]|nr:MAG: asparagine synthase (glutamine-hydrolyzing) [Candidatus Endolissoclinum sp. TMED37]|tara:strand:- start:177 stop:2051 length:1875 start_codon:yes stop_codon:yes gene_type:complete